MRQGDLLAGRYILRRRIGFGGMAEVWEAEDQTLARLVAVKALQGYAAADPQLSAAFLQEGRLVASLNHPNIVDVYDTGQEDDTPYLVMEYVQGRSLREYMKERGPLEVRVAIDIARQAAAGLEHAHRSRVVHQDVKPENILLARNGTVKLVDFGIARALGATVPTAATSVLGTFAYLAPEQIEGQRGDARSDVYALGVTTWEMLAGRLPYSSDAIGVIANEKMNAAPPSLRPVRPQAPSGLDAVLRRAMARDPGARFPSAAALSQALTTGDAGRTSTQRFQTRAAVPPAGPPGRRVTATAAGDSRRRRIITSIIIGEAILLAAVAAVVLAVVMDDGGGGGNAEDATPTPTLTSGPTAQPTETPTDEPTQAPSATATDEPTVTPEPTATPTEEASPTPQPPTPTTAPTEEPTPVETEPPPPTEAAATPAE